MRQCGLSWLLIFVAVLARFEHLRSGVDAFVPPVNLQLSFDRSTFKTKQWGYHRTFLSRPLYMYLGEEAASMRNEFGPQNKTQIGEPRETTADASAGDSSACTLPSTSGGNFGDIMSPKSTDADILFRDGLVTSESNSLAEVYDIRHPMDRIAVTANGNLQRIISSYYDAPVEVTLKHCNQIEANPGVWDRRVHLSVFDQVFCEADSTVQVHNEEWRSLVESGKIGLGQLFRYQSVLPEFILHAAGPTADGGFWRNYTLECPSMTCLIHEEFSRNVWDLSPVPSNVNGEEKNEE